MRNASSKLSTIAWFVTARFRSPYAAFCAEGKLIPTFNESLEDYNFLLSVEKLGLTAHRSRRLQPAVKSTPDLWPIEGRLMSGFAARTADVLPLTVPMPVRRTSSWLSSSPMASASSIPVSQSR